MVISQASPLWDSSDRRVEISRAMSAMSVCACVSSMACVASAVLRGTSHGDIASESLVG